MAEQIEVRAGARRQHRGAAMLCALKCLHYDWDAIYVSRIELEWMLGLERFKQVRLRWLEEDFSEYFPFQHQRSELGANMADTFAGQTLGFRPNKRNSDDPMRVGKLNFKTDPRSIRNEIKQTCLAPLSLGHVNGSELAITSLLTMLSHGQIGCQTFLATTKSARIPVLTFVMSAMNLRLLA